MSLQQPHDPLLRFRESIGDLRVVGMLFCFLGLVAFLGVAVSPSARRAQILMSASAVLLFGPGVWYQIAAGQIRRRQMHMIRLTLYVAIGQVAAVLGTLALGILFRALGVDQAAVMVPVVMVCFFVPAILALVWNLRRLESLAPQFLPMGTAFEPVNVQTVKPSTQSPGGSDAASTQG